MSTRYGANILEQSLLSIYFLTVKTHIQSGSYSVRGVKYARATLHVGACCQGVDWSLQLLLWITVLQVWGTRAWRDGRSSSGSKTRATQRWVIKVKMSAIMQTLRLAKCLWIWVEYVETVCLLVCVYIHRCMQQQHRYHSSFACEKENWQ